MDESKMGQRKNCGQELISKKGRMNSFREMSWKLIHPTNLGREMRVRPWEQMRWSFCKFRSWISSSGLGMTMKHTNSLETLETSSTSFFSVMLRLQFSATTFIGFFFPFPSSLSHCCGFISDSYFSCLDCCNIFFSLTFLLFIFTEPFFIFWTVLFPKYMWQWIIHLLEYIRHLHEIYLKKITE